MVWTQRLDPYFSQRSVNPMEVWRFSFEDCARIRLGEAIAEYEMVRVLIAERVVRGFHLAMWGRTHRMLKAIIREYRFFLGQQDFGLENNARRQDPPIRFHPRDAHLMAAIYAAKEWRQWAEERLEWCREDLREMVTVGRSAIPNPSRQEKQESNKKALYFINEISRWGKLVHDFNSVIDPPVFHWQYRLSNEDIAAMHAQVDKEMAEFEKSLLGG